MAWANKVRGTSNTPVPVFVDQMSAEDIKKEIGTGKERVWSSQQKMIFDWFATSKIGKVLYQHLIVIALAGTGKTTTIVEAIRYVPEGMLILLAAFNKRIATELESRVSHPNATVKTLHAVGFAIIRQWWPKVRVAKGYDRERDLALQVCGKNTPDAILKLVGKLHTKAREITPYAKTYADIAPLAEQFECDPDFFWHAQGYDLRYIITKALEVLTIWETEDMPKGGIDFADMIGIPVRRKWAMPMYDVGVVDEAQDMTTAQLELFRMVVKPTGRICVVGDPNQAIYGFRGADSGSLGRLKKELNAGELGLTTTYRCGKAIVNEAQRFVPDFEAGADNSDGEIVSIVREDMLARVAYGDFILSRLNAPLAGYAMQLLRDQRRARIAGRDIGQSLKTLVRKLAKGATDVETFLERVEQHASKQRARFMALKWESKIAELEDTVDTIAHIAEGCSTVTDMERVIDMLFTDDGLGDKGTITLSSVHKAKGLEADKVFVLGWTLRTGKSQEEDNIHYVAITRAKNVLTMVA